LSELDRGGANDDEISYSALAKACRGKSRSSTCANRTNGTPAMSRAARCTRCRPSIRAAAARQAGRADLSLRPPLVDALHAARAAGFKDIWHYKGGVLGWAQEDGELV